MRRFALIGKPLGHSLSPALFRLWFRRHEIEAEYRAIEAEENEVDALLKRLKAGELDGANVTVPYKERVFEKLAGLDETARAVGAVNTLCREGPGVFGLNTDAPAFAEGLKDVCPENPFTPKAACVFGSGGAARAVVHALRKQGVAEVRVVARNPGARAGIHRMGADIGFFPWEKAAAAAEGAALLVNATPLGMLRFPPFPEIALGRVAGGIAFDLVYNPPRSAFQEQARAAGYKTANGFSMLVAQAALAFKAWFGFFPDRAGITFEALAVEKGNARA